MVDHFLWHQHFNDDPTKTAKVVRIHMFDSLLETMRVLMDPMVLFEEPPEHIRDAQAGDLVDDRVADPRAPHMAVTKPMSNFAPYDKPQWGSDVMVDALRALGLRYVSLNPGSSFRGLHDSLVNYGGDDITMIECPHEKIALGVAHGYAKVTGEPMAVVLHTS